MARPVIGVIGNARLIDNRFPAQIVGENNMRAVAAVAGALPLMFAAAPAITDLGDLLDTVDGVLLTGGRANVHPTRFNAEPCAAHEPYDEARDALAPVWSPAHRHAPACEVGKGARDHHADIGGIGEAGLQMPRRQAGPAVARGRADGGQQPQALVARWLAVDEIGGG